MSARVMGLFLASLWALGCNDVNVGVGAGTDTGATLPLADLPAAADTLGALCTRDQQCWPAAVCLQGVCSRECVTAVECGPGRQCKDFRCEATQPLPDLGPPPPDPGPAPADPGHGLQDPGSAPVDPGPASSDPGPPPFDPGPSQDSGCGFPIAQGYSAPCKCPAACATGLCLGRDGDLGFCTKRCSTAKDCPGKDACFDLGTDEQGAPIKLCSFSDSGKEVDCQAGLCNSTLNLPNGMNECVCTVECVDASDCQANAACAFVATPFGNKKLCVPVGGPCDPSQTAQSPCFNLCYPTTLTEGFCTATCESTLDCPAASPCVEEVLPDGTRLKTCR